MKKLSYLAVTTGLLISTSAAASGANNSIEARLNALEQRLQQSDQDTSPPRPDTDAPPLQDRVK